MESKILTDLVVLAFFILLIAFKRYLFTERFLKFLRKNWFWIALPIIWIIFFILKKFDTPYTQFVYRISGFFVFYFFVYGYYSVYPSLLRSRERLIKKIWVIYLPIAPIPIIYWPYNYFTTEPYHPLDIVIFVFFLGTVIYVSHFLLKETFFSRGE